MTDQDRCSTESRLFTACPDCDLLIHECLIAERRRARCPRCGCIVHEVKHNSVVRCLAASCAGLLLLFPALTLPLLHFEMLGRSHQTSVIGSVMALIGQQQWWLSALILVCSALVPLLQLLIMAAASWAQWQNRRPSWLRPLLRWSFRLREWGMLEIYLLSLVVAMIKLEDDGLVLVDTGLYSLAGLLFCSTLATSHFDRQQVWRHWGAPDHRRSGEPGVGKPAGRRPVHARLPPHA